MRRCLSSRGLGHFSSAFTLPTCGRCKEHAADAAGDGEHLDRAATHFFMGRALTSRSLYSTCGFTTMARATCPRQTRSGIGA